jgi:ABC-type xylose transport system substrate-binding protein
VGPGKPFLITGNDGKQYAISLIAEGTSYRGVLFDVPTELANEKKQIFLRLQVGKGSEPNSLLVSLEKENQ